MNLLGHHAASEIFFWARRLQGTPSRSDANSGSPERALFGAPGRYARRKAAFFEVLAGGAAGIASAFLARRNALSLAVLR